jgi:hypothetical protein
MRACIRLAQSNSRRQQGVWAFFCVRHENMSRRVPHKVIWLMPVGGVCLCAAAAAAAACRTRAAVPQPSRMDFVINPGSRVDPLDGPKGGLQPGAKPGGKPKVRETV